VVNRADLGNDLTEGYCRKENISILMKIPFKKEIAMAYSKGIPLVVQDPGFKDDFKRLFDNIENRCKA
jgi:MinD superfamily P-loop ATPase